MKLNKWTVGLAAVGAISLSSAVQAEESQMNVVNAVTSGTTIGGYVSTSFSYNFNTAVQGVTAANPMGAGQANGFNLDVVNLTIEKPLDESEWAAGYKAEFLFGPDAKYVGTSSLANTAAANGDFSYDTGSDFAIKQAYVNLRAPVGNGLEFKMGVFDTIIGYEAYNFNANPNFTRSLGWAIEPTQHTGLLSSYRINDIVSVTAGIAETASAPINNRPSYTGVNFTKDQFNLTYMGAVAVTAPEDMGALAGSTLYGGVVYGRVGTGSITGNATPGATGGNSTSWYAGLTLATGVEGLSVGGAFDYLDYRNTANTSGAASGSTWVGGLYASYQATEKLSFHTRGEYQRLNTGYADLSNDDAPSNNWEATVTAQYDLWQNVISRLEFRWDNSNAPSDQYGDAQQGTTLNNAYMVALNVIYTF
jgi:hypothetical protein